MRAFLIRAVVAALGLWVADLLIAGVRVDDLVTLALAALLLGVVNAIIRPIITILTLPITLITLGLFLLVVNAAMLGLVAWLLPGFSIDGLWSGVLAAIVTGLISWVGQAVTKDARR
ncbi:MAG: phage holin family protein [Caulobacteraceae bacterium]|nr:phage holin family protein [Caulobacteraceae bacterium]